MGVVLNLEQVTRAIYEYSQDELYDSYALRGGEVRFYEGLDNKQAGMQIKVGLSCKKVLAWEGLCKQYHDSFETLGWLRLHTPICPHQEMLGTDFLSVPSAHRERIFNITKGQPLVTIKPEEIFCTIGSGEKITMEQLLGGAKLTHIVEKMELSQKLFIDGWVDKGHWYKVISEEQWRQDKDRLNLSTDTSFFIFRMKVNLNSISCGNI